MIYSLTGKVIDKSPNEVVIECGGVGYLINIPVSASGSIPAVGGECTMYTYLNVKEDALDLYGFSDIESKKMFMLLTSVSGVGPKAGLSILSTLTSDRIALAIGSADHKALTAANGVGPKMAQRIVLELKDKVGLQMTNGIDASDFIPQNNSSNSSIQAISALTSLGYSQSEAAMAITKIDPNLPVAEIIRLALKGMAK